MTTGGVYVLSLLLVLLHTNGVDSFLGENLSMSAQGVSLVFMSIIVTISTTIYLVSVCIVYLNSSIRLMMWNILFILSYIYMLSIYIYIYIYIMF